MPLLLCNGGCAPGWSKGSGEGVYEVSSEKEGGAGARGIRYEGSAAGTSGEGYEVRLEEAAGVSAGLIEATEAGRDGKSWESLSDPEVFCRLRGGRFCAGEVPRSTTGEPARKAGGTELAEGALVFVGEPIWSGEGTPSMVVVCAPTLLTTRLRC